MESWTIAEIARRLETGELSLSEQRRLSKDRRAGVQRLLTRWEAQRVAAAAEEVRLAAMLEHERPLWGRGIEWIAGVDEVGAGPLAGPVVAAAVVLPPGTSLPKINDSKQLTAAQREALNATIQEVAVAWSVGACSVAEIDRLNIYQAALQAMRRAVDGLSAQPMHLLVDARRVPGVVMPQTALVDGDTRSQSIAAASIVAKVYRDRLMDDLGARYPGYGFERHRGYGTAAHLEALASLGPCAEHRVSFGPVAQAARRLAAHRESGASPS